MNPVDEFADALVRAGIPAERIIPDGRLHRYHIEGDKLGTLNGWYVLHLDGIPAGAYGSWKHSVTGTWRAGGGRLSAADRELIERAKREEQAERERRHAEARERARTLWERAQPATSHEYLTAKRINPYGARTLSGLLVLPVQDFDGQIHSLQFIAADGGKKLLSGGRKKGHFISVRWTGADRLLICEGFATGASLAEIEPGSDVLAAIDAGNLLHVACEARRRFPGREIVICADHDPVGIEKAHAAAAASLALVAIPETEGADWNDMHRREVAAW